MILGFFQPHFHPLVLRPVVIMLIVSMVRQTVFAFAMPERLETHMKAAVLKEGLVHQHHAVPMLNVVKLEVESNASANQAIREILTFDVKTLMNVLAMLVVSMLSASINQVALTVAVQNLSLETHLSNVRKYPVRWIVQGQNANVAPTALVQLDSHAVPEFVETFALMSPVEGMLSALKENADVHLVSLGML